MSSSNVNTPDPHRCGGRRWFTSAVAVVGALVAPIANAQTTFSADSFVDSIGVAVHLDNRNQPYWDNWNTGLKDYLLDLGVRHIRDGFFALPSDQAVIDRHRDLGENHGIKLTANLTTRDGVGELDESAIDFRLNWAQFYEYGNFIEAVEGPNEWDVFNPSQSPAHPGWKTDLQNYQAALYAGMRSRPGFDEIPLAAPPLAFPLQMDSMGDYSDIADLGSGHPYTGGLPPAEGQTSTHFWGVQRMTPGLPHIVTEVGYHDAINFNGGNAAASSRAYTIYQPQQLLHLHRRGVARTFMYELVDDRDGTSLTDKESKFGLIDTMGSDNNFTLAPKPAYYAVKNLIDVLEEPGAGAFDMRELNYSLSGDTNGLETMVLQKSNGDFYLAAWLQHSVWDINTKTDLFPADQSVTVSFGEAIQSAELIRPGSNTSGPQSVNTWATPGAITFDASTEVQLIRLTPSGPAPNKGLVIDDLADFSVAQSASGWTLLPDTNETRNWNGDVFRAFSNGGAGNHVTYEASGLTDFTTKIAIETTGSSQSPANYDFSLLSAEVSPDGVTWTPIALTPGASDLASNELALFPRKWTTELSPSAPLPAGTNYLRFVAQPGSGQDSPSLLEVRLMQDVVAPPAAVHAQEASGIVSIEAEKYDWENPRGEHFWAARDDVAGASDGGFLRAETDDAADFAYNYETVSPIVSYDVEIDQAGKYYVWVRGFADDADSDSLHVGLNGEAVDSANRITGFGAGAWDWTSDTADSASRATLFIDSEGTHTLHVWMQESGFRVDKLVLTQDESFVPSGFGPAETLAELLAGDYDGNGVVDMADYQAWRDAFGTGNPAADGNASGLVDLADYTVWRDAFALASSQAIPEPTTLGIGAFAFAQLAVRRRASGRRA